MTQAADSSQVGYLRPTVVPIYDTELEDLFQRVIRGVTGLAGNLVRPKYQDNPPTFPEFDVDWCAFSVYVEPIQWNSYRVQEDDVTHSIQGEEVMRLTCSFWGPNYQALERRWRDGMQVPQNREELDLNGIAFIEFADPVIVPLLLKERWVKHVDIRGTFKRWAVRGYKVLTLLSANGTIHADRTPAGEVIGTFQTDPPPT